MLLVALNDSQVSVVGGVSKNTDIEVPIAHVNRRLFKIVVEVCLHKPIQEIQRSMLFLGEAAALCFSRLFSSAGALVLLQQIPTGWSQLLDAAINERKVGCLYNM